MHWLKIFIIDIYNYFIIILANVIPKYSGFE